MIITENHWSAILDEMDVLDVQDEVVIMDFSWNMLPAPTKTWRDMDIMDLIESETDVQLC